MARARRSGSDPRGGDSPDKRTVRGDEEGNGHPGGIPLTPEERIVELLERNEGRMKQQEIAAAVDYSESTVSRKLCEMGAEEVVTRFRIGREKVVFLPGAVPAFFDSPLGRMGPD